MARRVREIVKFNTNEAFAAACAAQRVNGEYLKQSEHDEEGDLKRHANKHLIRYFLDGTFQILDQDRKQAKLVIKHFQGLTFKILQGKFLNDFENTAMACANSEEVGAYELAVISSLPSSFKRAMNRANIDARIRDTVGYVGNVGDKTELSVEVARSYYSDQWNTWYITCITNDNKNVRFSYKTDIAVGRVLDICGKIKEHRENSTKLTHVKEI